MLKLLEPRHYRMTELEAESGLPKSAIRYYLKNVLDDYVRQNFNDLQVAERKAALYPAAILDRLLFIKKAKEELRTVSGNRIEPSTRELKAWMGQLTDEEVRGVVSGSEPLEFGVTKVEDGARVIKTLRGETLAAGTTKYGRPISANDESTRRKKTEWQTVALSPNLQVRYRNDLGTPQQRQLQLLLKLLKTMLDEE